MKVMFLDIDGVLNSDQTPNPRKLPYVVDRKLLTRLKRVLKRTGAKVVLSSTWRYDPAGLFSAKYHGIPFIGVTPDMPHRPGATKFLAGSRNIQRSTGSPCLMTTTMNSTSCLFQPSAATGLTEDIAKGVIRYLDGKTNNDMRKNYVERLFENARAVVKGHKG